MDGSENTVLPLHVCYTRGYTGCQKHGPTTGHQPNAHGMKTQDCSTAHLTGLKREARDQMGLNQMAPRCVPHFHDQDGGGVTRKSGLHPADGTVKNRLRVNTSVHHGPPNRTSAATARHTAKYCRHSSLFRAPNTSSTPAARRCTTQSCSRPFYSRPSSWFPAKWVSKYADTSAARLLLELLGHTVAAAEKLSCIPALASP